MITIHDFSKCVTGIFSLVTGDYFIRGSGIIYIENKENGKWVKVIISHKSAMDLDTSLFKPTMKKIIHSSIGQAQAASMYVPSNNPLSMDRKDQKHCIKPLFLISQF